jgi:60 kDa SS-A/Ro ribonucleoprotein
MLTAWAQFKKRNPRARLVCIDLIARDNSQVKAHEDILQVGGFSDQVFEVVNSFLEHGHSADHWVSVIEGVSLD